MTVPDDRSPQAIAYHWASRVMTIALEMVIPGLLGYWLDGRLGTRVAFTVAGFGLGLTMGIWHLLRMFPADQRQARSRFGAGRPRR